MPFSFFRIRYPLHIFNNCFLSFSPSLFAHCVCSSVLRRCANSLSCALCRVHRSDASASAPPPSDLFAAFAASLPSAGRCFSCPSFALPLSPFFRQLTASAPPSVFHRLAATPPCDRLLIHRII
ncbi:hypothetical protein niasHS_002133 [Heterodera schachtii]|uniref:Secreted protein n=1 Tax=Heterodera schachtii TaxID=97005 RepID=A0ABD2KMG1_HETSC